MAAARIVSSAAHVGDGGGSDAEACTGSYHPLAVEEWLASRVLEHVANAREICRLALVNKNFCEASRSDLVWQKQLPPKPLLDAIFSALTTLHSSPLPRKRDLYMQLCKSIPYDNHLKKFWLDPTSGGDCYMISARGLSVVWGDAPQYWKWQPLPGAMFQEVAYLKTVCWFCISGTFCQILRPGKYLVSFRIQLDTSREVSWRESPIKLCLENISYGHPPHLSQVLFDGTTAFKRRFCPLPETTPSTSQIPSTPNAENGYELHTAGMQRSNVHTEEEQGGHSNLITRARTRLLRSSGRLGGTLPSPAIGRKELVASRDDDILRFGAAAHVESSHETGPFHSDWIECDVGEFLVEDDNGGRPVEVQFSMKEIEVLWWKGGFVLDGVIMRPSFVAEKDTIE